MLGTIALIVILIAGYLELSFWCLVPAAIINAFLGLHFPHGKAQFLQAQGQYWRTYFASLPLQALFTAAVFGVGYGASALIKNI